MRTRRSVPDPHLDFAMAASSDDIKALFAEHDEAKDGRIARSGLVEVLVKIGSTEEKASEMVDEVDKTKVGSIDYNAFVDWFMTQDAALLGKAEDLTRRKAEEEKAAAKKDVAAPTDATDTKAEEAVVQEKDSAKDEAGTAGTVE